MGALARSVALVVALAGAGCSLLLNPASARQCEVDSDCESEPALRGMVCRGGICARPAGPSLPVSADSGTGCVDSASCTKANTGKASVCKVAGSPCLQWQTAQCATIAGAWDDPNVIMLGAIIPLTYRQKDGTLIDVKYAKRQQLALTIALDDVKEKNPWFIVSGNVKRPLGLLVCDSQGDPQKAREAFDHLTDTVGVQGMFVSYDDDLDAIKAKATEKQTAIACTDCLAPIPPGPLVWRTWPQITDEAVLISRRVKQIEQELATPIKVTFIKEIGIAQDAFEKALLSELSFNNKPAIDQIGTEQAPGAFQVIRLPDGRKESYLVTDYTDKIVSHGPHIVIAIMGPDLPTKYLTKIESGATFKPHYVLTNISRDSVPEWQSALTTSTTDLRKRVSGTRPYVSPEIKANMDAFTAHFRPKALFQYPDGVEFTYDAFFSLFYALTSATTQPIIDGPHISAGFESLIAGPPVVNVGTGDIDDALIRLTKKQTIDLRGTATTLDWDKKTHELPGDVGMWCFKTDNTINDNAGPRYRTADPSDVGTTFKCDP